MIIRILTRQAMWRIAKVLQSAGSLYVLFDILDEQEEEVGCYKQCQDQIHSYEYDII